MVRYVMTVFYTILILIQLIELESPFAWWFTAVVIGIAIYQQIKVDRGRL